MHSRTQLSADLQALGVAASDLVMVHASVRAVGEVAGGPDEIHLALKHALTERGTLMMYAGCPQYVDEVGRGNLSAAQEREVLDKLPPFDPDTARSARDHGVLVECLRTHPGSRVNRHPARFDRFVSLGGKILLLGCDHDSVTFLHHVEHVADIPGRRIARFKVPIMEHGARVWRDMQEFDTSGAGVHRNWPDRCFARIVDSYLEQAVNRGGRVGDAWCHLFDAADLLRFARPVMERLAVDPRAADRLRELPDARATR